MLDIDTVFTASEEAKICLECPLKRCHPNECARLKKTLEKLKAKHARQSERKEAPYANPKRPDSVQ